MSHYGSSFHYQTDTGLIYSLLTAKSIDLSLLIDYSTYSKDIIQ